MRPDRILNGFCGGKIFFTGGKLDPGGQKLNLIAVDRFADAVGVKDEHIATSQRNLTVLVSR